MRFDCVFLHSFSFSAFASIVFENLTVFLAVVLGSRRQVFLVQGLVLSDEVISVVRTLAAVSSSDLSSFSFFLFRR